jgi:hypothetical protein
MIGVSYNSTTVAPTKIVNIQGIQASQASILASRTITDPLKSTNVSIAISIASPIATPVTVTISTVLNIFYGSVTGAWLVGASSNAAIGYTSSSSNGNGSYVSNMTLTVPQLTATTTLLFQTTNSPLMPLAGSRLSISIYNSSMIFYNNPQVAIAQ